MEGIGAFNEGREPNVQDPDHRPGATASRRPTLTKSVDPARSRRRAPPASPPPFRPANLDAAVALLEADQVGGTNLNRVRPLCARWLGQHGLARDWTSWSVFGLEGPPPKPNLEAILANSDRVARYVFEKKHLADQLQASRDQPRRAPRPRRVHRPAHVDRKRWPRLAGRSHRSWPWRAAAPTADPGSELALTYNDIRTLKALPAATAVVGAADTGCQSLRYSPTLAVGASLFEAAPTIVPHTDAQRLDRTRSSVPTRRASERTPILRSLLCDD